MIYLASAVVVFLCVMMVLIARGLEEQRKLIMSLYPIAEASVETPDAPEIADEPETESIDASELTETELLIIEREAEFDLRIAKMKEELAYQQVEKKDNPTEAVSLHPGVQNLPHHIITDLYDSLPDVEYTR